MEGNELVSVIIPVYNVLPYLSEALDSVINQTYKNLEIIIVDDGSTDGSGKICDEYAENDKRVRVIHQENKGLSSARNIGLDAMTGEMVVFVDSDDACRPDYVETMMKAMKRDNADLIVCRFTIHNTTGRMEPSGQDKLYPSIKEGIYDRVPALKKVADGTINPGVWNKLYRSELWKDICFPEGHVYENVDTTFRIFNLCHKVSVLNQPLYYYRKRSGAITEITSTQNVNDWLLARSHFEAFIKANIPEVYTEDDLKQFFLSRLNQLVVFYAALSGDNSGKKKDVQAELRKKAIEIGKKYSIKECKLTTQLSYVMIRYFPWIVRIVYPVYYSVKRFHM